MTRFYAERLIDRVLTFQIFDRSLVRSWSGLLSTVSFTGTRKPWYLSVVSSSFLSDSVTHMSIKSVDPLLSPYSSARVFLPTMFFKSSTVSQRRKTWQTKQHPFKTVKTWNKTHLGGGNHHNLLEIIKCHFVATRCGPQTARGKDRCSFRFNRKRRWNTQASFLLTAPPDGRTRAAQTKTQQFYFPISRRRIK